MPSGGAHNREHTKLVADVRRAVSKACLAALYMNQQGFDERTSRPYGLGIGSPDLVGYTLPKSKWGAGRFVGFEIKTGRGELELAQRSWHEAALDSSCVCCVVRSVDEAIDALE